MFTEGLDESALSWVKQQSGNKESEARSPLSEKSNHDFDLPKSPLGFNSSTYKSTHVLPPLKFHSGLLGSQVKLNLESSDEDDFDYEENYGESVASVADDFDENFSEDDEFGGASVEHYEEGICGLKASTEGVKVNTGLNLNRGFLQENLRIQVPENRKCFRGEGAQSATSGSSYRLRDSVQFHSAYGTPVGGADLGTPSAPPFMDMGRDDSNSEMESGTVHHIHIAEELTKSHALNSDKKELDSRCDPGESGNSGVLKDTAVPVSNCQMDPVNQSVYYSTSGQNAWQSLVAYDACFRLCLNAWTRGCMEAPEFLRDECLLLRNAFGLHTLLLQPRGAQSTGKGSANTADMACPSKVKKTIGKIRVEVRKLRIIPRRKLKSTNSLRGAMYMQVGAEYVRHVSSLVKNSITSLRQASSNLTSEELWKCSFYLKSSLEDGKDDSVQDFTLRPGTGDYHEFFPESQGDALILEVQDLKKTVQGRATIPISSLIENPNDRMKWWPIYHDDHECVGKIQLSVYETITYDDSHMKNGPIVETLAYDILLESAMRAQNFHAQNLWIDGPWKWLLSEFADYYGVSDSYTKLRYLSHVMNVATPKKDCLELIYQFLVPVIKTRGEKRLTRQEKSMLLDCETQVESLLANIFENYKSLDENSPTGLSDLLGPLPEAAAPALAPAVQVYTIIHDILAQDAQMVLRNYIKTAAAKRCKKHMVETDEFVSSNSDGFLMDSFTSSTAYLKIKKLCIDLSNEIQADIKIHNEHILPSSIDLSSITAAVYSSELCKRLTVFLAAWPPSSPNPHVNELLIATADFERNLELWNISPVPGGVDSRNLYHNYIMVWVQDMQLNLLEYCKAEKVSWSGVITNYSTSPFPEEIYERIREMLIEYEVVITRWPQYTLVLENAIANVERAIIKALEKQYSDVLTPLKDSIPKRLGIQVQKLTRRQSTTVYALPSQLGTFLNTIKRILDVLHCKVEDKLKTWASYLPVGGDKKSNFGEQMNEITVLLRTKYKNYTQAIVVKLVANANRSTRLQRILEETKEADGEAEIRERMQMLISQVIDSISNLHEVFTSPIFIATCRGFWDRMGQIVLKFLEVRKENRVWYRGSYHALGILDDTFASQMQRLQGNALKDKDMETPRSICEARSILCRDTTNATDTYF
ncbi:uncharacterized protein LOC108219853 isoform X2 [Daucus carota subsp. sativus]|uniref:uncharacterized protein LOC108219853 isoform X2 n=1 Tax=Daucus carota subsp. sativus TaxID=79200 RepID=UPI003082EC61